MVERWLRTRGKQIAARQESAALNILTENKHGIYMSTKYKAVEVVRPGVFNLTQRPLTDPPPGHVRIRVEACGVCHSDSATVEAVFPIQFPRVPGHEAVGRIDALGQEVEGWKIGQRVGVGFLAGNCGYCIPCRSGDLVNC